MILRHKGNKNNAQFLVKWKGHAKKDISWEPAENLKNSPQLL